MHTHMQDAYVEPNPHQPSYIHTYIHTYIQEADVEPNSHHTFRVMTPTGYVCMYMCICTYVSYVLLTPLGACACIRVFVCKYVCIWL